MPHRCTNCGNRISDGSDELLQGCEECSNQSWEYIDVDDKNQSDFVGEDESQERARTAFVDPKELPDENPTSLQNPSAGYNRNPNKITEVERIRSKLNKQYEGISVHKKGHYSINLTELYRGNSYVIEIGEDGAYQVKEVKKDS